MKTLIIITIIILSTITSQAHEVTTSQPSPFFDSMTDTDKAAILIVYFGTTHDDTRTKTIDALNQKVKQQFPQVETRNAYTSRIVLKRLKDRGVDIQNPLQALQQLHDDGYTHILVLASTIINGVEFESLNKNIEAVSTQFKDIRVSTPLLYTPHDYKTVIKELTTHYNPDTAYVWVGHGTYDATTAQYTMVDYILKAQGHTNCFVGTIEGYPEYDDMLQQLKKSGLKNIQLVPFMFVAGEHAKNDIAQDWKQALEEEGFTVNVDMRGLGENPQIQNIYLSHLDHIAHHRKVGIMEKKAVYEITGEKY